MEILTFFLVSIVSAFVGAVAAWKASDAHNQRERDDLERDMRDEIDERYRAYEAIEQRVSRVIQAFDAHEAEFERRLENQKSSIEDLKRALIEQNEALDQELELEPDPTFIEKAKDTGFLGLPDGDPAAAFSPFEDALSVMDVWEQRVETVSEQKAVRIDEHSEEIARLTEKVRRLEPLSATVFKRESEIETWKRKYGELETALALQSQALEDVVADLKPKAAELSDHAAAERTLRERFESRLGEQVSLLDQRDARIRELQSELAASSDDIERLAGELQRAQSENGRLKAELELGADELAASGARIRALQAEASAAAEARTGELQAATVELDELRAERRRIEHDLAELRGELAESAKELDELGSVHDGTLQKVEWLTRHLNTRERELEQRDGEVFSLNERVEQLEQDLAEARGSLQGQSGKITELMRELDDASQRAQSKSSTLSQAHELLESLRPVIQSLESTLGPRD